MQGALPRPGRNVPGRIGLLAGVAALLALGSTLLLLGGGVLPAPVEIPFRATFQILVHELTFGRLYPNPCAGTSVAPTACASRTFIVWQIVVPEVLLALIVGAGLGISGASLQGIFRNPLADPYLLGIATGGTLGAAVVDVYNLAPSELNLVLPLVAFLGAVGTGLAILLVARGRATSVETLLLAGVAISYLLSGVLSIVLLYNPYRAEQVTFWLLGGLGFASWSVDAVAFALVLGLGSVLAMFGRELNLLQLGSEVAQSCGVDARRVRVTVILLASLITAGVVAFTGVIGFVGLVSPHIVRRWVGTDYRIVLPVSGAVGATFLVLANDAASLTFPRSVLPVGIFTAFAGVPFFLIVLYRHRQATLGGPA